jgi:hypothetical protein
VGECGTILKYDGEPQSCPAVYLLGEEDQRLDTLRKFRDEVLAKSSVTSGLITLYYNYGNQLIALLDSSPTFKIILRKILEIVVPKDKGTYL